MLAFRIGRSAMADIKRSAADAGGSQPLSRTRADLSPYEVAYLAGGAARVADTATVNLLRQGLIHVGSLGQADARARYAESR